MNILETTVETDFLKRRVVIIGDLVADQFLNGTISRVSREAPVFILRHDQTETKPGAAANAAANVASLGGIPVLIGLAGTDPNGDLLLQKLNELGVDAGNVITDSRISTTTKVRVLAGQHYASRQQVIRIDYESIGPISEQIKRTMQERLIAEASAADAIIVSDYNYGAVFPEIFDTARSVATDRGIPLVVDSRFRLTGFPGATTATPNREEVGKVLGKSFSVDDCAELRGRLGYRSLLVTNGNEGMLLFEENCPPLNMNAIGSKEPVDVTGAGDTVIAAYALGLASKLGFADSAMIANHAGGIVVMKKGTSTVTTDELLQSLRTEARSLTSKQSN